MIAPAWRRFAAVAIACAGLLQAGASVAADEEFRFDASEFEKKAYEFGGFLEAKPQYFWLNPGSAGYNLVYPDGAPGNAAYGATGTLELVGKYTVGVATARFRTHSDIQRYNTVDQQTNKFYEAVLSVRPDPGFTADIGKVALQWGKGYAQTFVGFVQRPKDPDDPEAARQGYTIVGADLIRNFAGPLQTVAFTPVILPVSSRVNSDYGARGHVNLAAKLYMLLQDTDIDLMYGAKGSRPARFGMDFSRNLATNFEIHGEWAYIWNTSRPVVDSTGRVTTQQRNVMNYMAGLRYLTERDTTWIVEYYHNGSGYSQGQMDDFYDYVDGIFGPPPINANALQNAVNLYRGGYGRPYAMRNYLYAQATQKEPFDILYFTPGFTTMVNLDDHSFQITPELLYTGVKDLELRLRLYAFGGGDGTEFGEKPNSRRLELRVRYYF